MGRQLWLSGKTGKRRRGTSFEELQNVFANSIPVSAICEGLFCFDQEANSYEIKERADELSFDIVGILDRDDNIVGFVKKKDLNGQPLEECIREFQTEKIVSDRMPIWDLLPELNDRDFCFVSDEDGVNQIITRSDINKPLARVYIFGIISLFEMHLNFWVDKFYKDNSWKKIITKKRLENATNIYNNRKGENLDLSLLSCLQIADKKVILCKTANFGKLFDFSRTKLKKLLEKVEKIRNEIAHSQTSVVANLEWKDFTDTIKEAGEFLTNSEKEQEGLNKANL